MIKLGDPGTINDLAWLGSEWAKDFNIEDFDEDSWLELVRGYSIYVDYHAAVMYNNLNQPVGFLLGAIVKVPHNKKMTGQIHYMYVLPKHADHETFYELHSEFVEWAKTFQVTEISAPDFYTIPDEYMNFIKDIGYESGYITYIKGI